MPDPIGPATAEELVAAIEAALEILRGLRCGTASARS